MLEWILPIKTISENNSNEHWSSKARRHKLQRKIINVAFLKEKPQILLPCRVVLTRIAPRKLDFHDNLPGSFKWIVDAFSENIINNKSFGRADDDERILWFYCQEKGAPKEYAVKIQVFDEPACGKN